MECWLTFVIISSDLDEDVQGMSGLECAQVMKCVRQCLANILGPSEAAQLPTDICESMNMSSKYKAATQLTDCIKVSLTCVVVVVVVHQLSFHHRTWATRQILATRHSCTSTSTT